jgi:hypothetical protein
MVGMKRNIIAALCLLSVLAAISIALNYSIGKPAPDTTPIDTPIDFAAVLTDPQVIKDRLAAEQDLFSDSWTTQTKGGHYNRSRSRRVDSIARSLLDNLEPTISRMTTQAIFDSILTDRFEIEAGLPYGEVPRDLYFYANIRLMAALKRKPRSEVLALQAKNGANDKGSIDTGMSGPPLRKDLLKEWLLEHPDWVWTPGY